MDEIEIKIENVRFILETTGDVRKKIAQTFGVTPKTVFNALTYDKKRGFTDVATRIRKMAIENGAVEMVILPAVAIADFATRLKTMKFTKVR